jgi:hypothetical protein
LCSDELRSWWIRHEVLLFRCRWELASKDERQMLVETGDFNFHPIASDEKDSLAPFLRASSPAIAAVFDKEIFFKVVLLVVRLWRLTTSFRLNMCPIWWGAVKFTWLGDTRTCRRAA